MDSTPFVDEYNIGRSAPKIERNSILSLFELEICKPVKLG
jgi:hypothetical protein